ncbi:MAG TPA: FHA domain-containing protein [Chthoniobacteraceae bacterium]|jgi:ABC-type multidrug transport system ATPase subunit|nr:FHA domain-containing protein [Chthoniobacteraceae bacterium]
MKPDSEAASGYFLVLAGLPLRALPVGRGKCVLGRAAESDFRLDHCEVSRRHCEVECDGAAFWITDLQSQWGTRIGPVAITARTQLEPGDIVSLGAVQLLFEAGAIPTPAEIQRRAGLAATAAGAPPPPILIRGAAAQHIPLGERTTLGRDAGSDVVLNSPAVSRHHAVVIRDDEGCRIEDLQSSGGSFVNGKRFDEHRLVIGDRLQTGPFYFLFDGRALHSVSAVSGGGIHAREVTRIANGRTLLEDISLEVAPARFVGIIGPSGAGKSSLLSILAGLASPTSGLVAVDDVRVTRGGGADHWGFVPQAEIVHAELTVSQALDFAARLRFPRETPPLELRKLILQTMAQLGLREHAGTRIGDLSGGQRKRASVAVELLARPPVLFLDEPTSGLDPATEFKLMEILRDLADRGCTVLCTTHVMENVYLMDQVTVLIAGRAVYTGTPQEVRDFFGVQRLATLYDRLEEKAPAEWIAAASAAPLPPAPGEALQAAPPRHGPTAAGRLVTLLRRQWAILCSDWRNAALLAVQPLALAALVGWVSDDASLRLFFAYIAALWFGCSNASQELVRERPIYLRERIAGVTPELYIAAKLLFLGAVTAAQSLLFYLTLQCFGGVGGAMLWQLAALLLTAISAVAIGALISALARNLMQAVVAVPLVLIPFILFSGQAPSASELSRRPVISEIARFMPSFAAQRCMDLSFFWHRRIAADTTAGHEIAYRNLPADSKVENGAVFTAASPGWHALGVLLLWTCGCAAATSIPLRRQ